MPPQTPDSVPDFTSEELRDRAEELRREKRQVESEIEETQRQISLLKLKREHLESEKEDLERLITVLSKSEAKMEFEILEDAEVKKP